MDESENIYVVRTSNSAVPRVDDTCPLPSASAAASDRYLKRFLTWAPTEYKSFVSSSSFPTCKNPWVAARLKFTVTVELTREHAAPMAMMMVE